MTTRFLGSGAQQMKASRERPPVSIPGVAKSTHGGRASRGVVLLSYGKTAPAAHVHDQERASKQCTGNYTTK